MAAEGIRIVVNDAAALGGLDKLDVATGNRRAAMEAIDAYLVTSAQRRFERETGPDGRPWTRLKPSTAGKRINGRPRGYANILRVTASSGLYSSIFGAVEDDDLILVGSNKKYAAIHQLGGEIEMPERQQTIYQHYDAKTDTFDPKFRKPSRSNFARDVTVKAHTVPIPARPYLGIDDEDRKEIREIIAEHYRLQGGVE